MKTAEDIVRALAACDEPLEEGYDTCAMPECGALRVDHGPERPIEEHRPDCPYRMAREWVEANPRASERRDRAKVRPAQPSARVIAREIAFRRGLEHGAHYVLKFLELGQTRETLRAWVNKTLHEYRLKFRDKHDPTGLVPDHADEWFIPIPSPVAGKVL